MAFSLEGGKCHWFWLQRKRGWSKKKKKEKEKETGLLCWLQESFLVPFQALRKNAGDPEDPVGDWPVGRRAVGHDPSSRPRWLPPIPRPHSKRRSSFRSTAKPSRLQQARFCFRSTTNLENLTIIPTVFSVWAEMKTVVIVTELHLRFKFYLVWRLFQYTSWTNKGTERFSVSSLSLSFSFLLISSTKAFSC